MGGFDFEAIVSGCEIRDGHGGGERDGWVPCPDEVGGTGGAGIVPCGVGGAVENTNLQGEARGGGGFADFGVEIEAVGRMEVGCRGGCELLAQGNEGGTVGDGRGAGFGAEGDASDGECACGECRDGEGDFFASDSVGVGSDVEAEGVGSGGQGELVIVAAGLGDFSAKRAASFPDSGPSE